MAGKHDLSNRLAARGYVLDVFKRGDVTGNLTGNSTGLHTGLVLKNSTGSNRAVTAGRFGTTATL